MYCPDCRGEYREGFTHCAHCDVDLVEELPPIPARDAEADGGPTLCARCGAAVPEWEEACERCGAPLEDPPQPEEVPAAAVETAPEPTGLRLFEIVLVVGIGFLSSTMRALYDWWNGGAPLSSRDKISNLSYTLSDLSYILSATLAISLLAYVLFRRGHSLKTIGLTFRKSDILWALVILFLDRLMMAAVHSDLRGFVVIPKFHPVGDAGLLEWLAVIPGAAKEELIVRAFLMTEVAELSGSWAIAVVVSVGFQSLYHLYQGTPGALIVAGSFFVSAVYYAGTRRITPVILAHSLHNFLYLAGH